MMKTLVLTPSLEWKFSLIFYLFLIWWLPSVNEKTGLTTGNYKKSSTSDVLKKLDDVRILGHKEEFRKGIITIIYLTWLSGVWWHPRRVRGVLQRKEQGKAEDEQRLRSVRERRLLRGGQWQWPGGLESGHKSLRTDWSRELRTGGMWLFYWGWHSWFIFILPLPFFLSPLATVSKLKDVICVS